MVEKMPISKLGKQTVWRYPQQAEINYREYLFSRIDLWSSIIEKSESSIQTILNSYNKENRTDSWATQLDELTDYYENKFNETFEGLEKKTKGIFNEISNYNKIQFAAIILVMVGAKYRAHEGWLPSYKDAFILTNQNLIKSLIGDTIKAITITIDTGIKNQLTLFQIKQQLIQKTKLTPIGNGFNAEASVLRKSKNRAKQISDNQTGVLNSQLQSKRAINYGLYGYRWDTALDEKVRSSHRTLEGLYFLFDYNININIPAEYQKEPPKAGNPGSEWGCRCYANLDFRWLK